jgi:DNA-binding NarL/FixJ family response regulator
MNSNGESDCVVQLCEAMQIGKIRILVVDDNQTVRLLLCEALRSHLDFEIVCESADAAAGISKAAELQPDVVILDISLPDMNGIEGVRRMRSIAPSAEILLCSQHDHIGMAMEGLKAGALGTC